MFEWLFGWKRRLVKEARVGAGDTTAGDVTTGSTERVERYIELTAEADALLREGKMLVALERYGAAAALNPGGPEAHLNLARAYLGLERFEAARRALSAAKECAKRSGAPRAVFAAIERAGAPLPPPSKRGNFAPDQALYSGLTGNRWTVLGDPMVGGFGAVYKVRDQDDSRVHALKTFQADLLWSEVDRRRFRREAAYWMRLRPHPNIVSAEWVEEIEDFPCVVQEFVEGGDLRHVLQTQKLSRARLLELGMQLCDAMQFAGESIGLVHRDLKPANCLLSGQGTLKVGDFGIAQCVADTAASLLELGGIDPSVRLAYTSPNGTQAYMAPEQHDARIVLDSRADIHAFGVMLFEMATGQRPQRGRDAHRFVTWSMEGLDLPRPWWELILHCVQPERDNRPGSFSEVRQALEALFRRETKREPARPAAPPRPGGGYWQNRAVAFQVLDLFDDAVRCCDEALKLEPGNGDLWQNRGAILHRADRNQEALKSLERAISLGVEDADVSNNLALVLRALGRDSEALSRLEEAGRAAPGDSRIAKNRAELLLAMGRPNDALEAVDALPEDSVREAALQEARIFVLIALGRMEEARQAADLLERQTPRRLGVWKAKAICAEQFGDRQGALEACRRALEIDNSDADMRTMRKRLAPGNGEV